MKKGDKVQKSLRDVGDFDDLSNLTHAYNLRRIKTTAIICPQKQQETQYLEVDPKIVAPKGMKKIRKFDNTVQKKARTQSITEIHQQYARKIKSKIYVQLGLPPLTANQPVGVQTLFQGLQSDEAAETVISQSVATMSRAMKVVKQRETRLENSDLTLFNVEFVRMCNAIDVYFT